MYFTGLKTNFANYLSSSSDKMNNNNNNNVINFNENCRKYVFSHHSPNRYPTLNPMIEGKMSQYNCDEKNLSFITKSPNLWNNLNQERQECYLSS